MHNLDRTMFEAGEIAHGETAELEQEDFLGILGSLLSGETGGSHETGSHETGSHETGSHGIGELGGMHELELASELLEVRDEAELDRFLGALLRSAAGAASNFARSPTGQALGGILKRATKEALPVVGRGIGGLVSPGGGEAGARIGRAAADLFGLELEGLSGEDREFEIARALIRFAKAACRNALNAPQDAPPAAVARQAALAAAHQHAPGLAAVLQANGGTRPEPAPSGPAPAGPAPANRARSGRWQRHGRAIVILDA
jgi:hypothetical protein